MQLPPNDNPANSLVISSNGDAIRDSEKFDTNKTDCRINTYEMHTNGKTYKIIDDESQGCKQNLEFYFSRLPS